jgi:hypothetical protein
MNLCKNANGGSMPAVGVATSQMPTLTYSLV